MLPVTVTRSAFVLLAAAVAPAQSRAPSVGDLAPPIRLANWIDAGDGEAPTLERLRGRAVLLYVLDHEFLDNAACELLIAQDLLDRYGAHGLTVLTITSASGEAVHGALEGLRRPDRMGGLPMLTWVQVKGLPIGLDPEGTVAAGYGMSAGRRVLLIGTDGRIADDSSLYTIEPAIQRSLGVDASSLLSRWLDAQHGADAAHRAAIEALCAWAPPDFGLRAWARERLGLVEAPQAYERDPAVHAAAAERLATLAAAWHDADRARRDAVLREIAAGPATAFDLLAFARERFRAAFPLEAPELASLLQQHRYADAVRALAERDPVADARRAVAADDALAAWCREALPGTLRRLEQALMLQHWLAEEGPPRDEAALWRDLDGCTVTMSVTMFSHVDRYVVGDAAVPAARLPSFVQDELARTVVLQHLGKGEPPPPFAAFVEQAERLRTATIAVLEARYAPAAADRSGGAKKE